MIKNAAIRGGSNRGLLLFALLLGLVSAVLIGVFLSQASKGGGGGGSGAGVSVVVASQDIPALTRISAGMVTVKDLPQDAILPGVFNKTESVVGQVTQVPLTAGEQIIANKVTATGAALQQLGGDVPLSFTIPEGKRAFSIGVSQIGAAGGLVRAGDFVDVILSGEMEVAGQEVNTGLAPGAACYVLQDVEVLAVGQHLKQRGTGDDASGIASSQADAEALSATLAVTPDQAWRLAATQRGLSQGNVTVPLWISLRPFGERGDSGGLPVCGVKVGS